MEDEKKLVLANEYKTELEQNSVQESGIGEQ